MNETTQDVARPNPLSTSRRVFLGGVGLAAGLAATRGRNWLGEDLTKYRFDDLFTLFEQSLSQTQRAHTFLSSDHPIRQVTLTEAAHRSPHIATLYNSFQVDLIRQMYGSMLSAQGRRWMQNTISLEGRFEGSIFKIYSDNLNNASAQNSQVVINGGHFMLRSNDLPSSGYALGGPIAYGQQLGNNQYKVEGNAFKAHGDALDLFHRALNKDERTIAYQQSPPNELLLQIQGHDSIFPGIRIGDTSDAAKELAREMLATLFEGFTANQQSDAWSAVNDNGGIESLHVAMYSDYGFYSDGSRHSDLSERSRQERGVPYIQVWRIEGPAFVIHFKGYPHVHAYMNIVKDPTKIAIGEALTEIKHPLDHVKTKSLVESTLKQRTGEALSFYPKSLGGRLSPGTVSTGSIYTLDPYSNDIVVAEIRAESMSQELLSSLASQGVKPVPGQRYKVTTIDYMLERPDILGVTESAVFGYGNVRDAVIAFVTDKDLSNYYA